MSLFIGLSALQTSQAGLNVISQNIANANTPGYHRQVVNLESLNDAVFRNSRIGSGVRIRDVERVRLAVIESLLTETNSDFQRADQLFLLQRQIENFFLPGEGSLQDAVDSLFNEISSLAQTPSDGTARELTVQSGALAADRFRELAANLTTIRQSIVAQINSELAVLNGEFSQLNSLNQEIVEASTNGQPPNGLLDTRESIINSISEKIGISRVEILDGSISLTFGNYNVQRQQTGIQFALNDSVEGRLSIELQDDTSRELQLSSGRLAALIETYNSVIPEYESKLDLLASDLIQRFDAIHATGLGADGPFNRLIGNRSVEDPNALLVDSTSFPVQSGDLYITVTDSNGNRTNQVISIDPFSQSLDDIATQISAIPNLTASINSETNRLQITATAGTRFDFTGAIQNVPDLSSYSGSAPLNFSGQYTGPDNVPLNFQIVGTGDVGISDDLVLRVTDDGGAVVADINIGNGYEAGSEIDLGDGIRLSIGPGTVNDGDSFSTTLIGNSDETGLLTALGINSFFTGVDASTIGVDQNIVEDPSRFASSVNADAADARQVDRFSLLGRQKLLDEGRLSYSEYLIEVTTSIGIEVQTSERLAGNLDGLRNQYQAERDSISGVDLNEEFVRLTQYQRSYEAAVRVIQTSESLLDELFAIIR